MPFLHHTSTPSFLCEITFLQRRLLHKQGHMSCGVKRSDEKTPPKRKGLTIARKPLIVMEARAGVEPTYTDLQSGA